MRLNDKQLHALRMLYAQSRVNAANHDQTWAHPRTMHALGRRKLVGWEPNQGYYLTDRGFLFLDGLRQGYALGVVDASSVRSERPAR